MDERSGAADGEGEPGFEEPPDGDRTLVEEDLPARIAELHARGGRREAGGATVKPRERARTLEWGEPRPAEGFPPARAEPQGPREASPRPARAPTRPGPIQVAEPGALHPRRASTQQADELPRPEARSETTAPRVRSGRLRHVRRAPAAPRPWIEPGASREDDRRARSEVHARALRTSSLVAIGWLGLAVVLPSARGEELVAPWRALLAPGSPGFVAAAFLPLSAMALGLPVGERLRSALVAGLGLLAAAFGLALLRDVSASGGFVGQPAVALLFEGSASARVVLALAATVLPAALAWRARQPGSIGARVLAATGAALLLFAYGGLSLLPGGEPMSLTAMAEAGQGGALRGDRVAAWLAFVPLLALPVVPWALRPAASPALPARVAVAYSLAVASPLVALALFVAPAERWLLACLPLQAVAVLAAGLLLTALGIGWSLGAALDD